MTVNLYPLDEACFETRPGFFFMLLRIFTKMPLCSSKAKTMLEGKLQWTRQPQ